MPISALGRLVQQLAVTPRRCVRLLPLLKRDMSTADGSSSRTPSITLKLGSAQA